MQQPEKEGRQRKRSCEGSSEDTAVQPSNLSELWHLGQTTMGSFREGCLGGGGGGKCSHVKGIISEQ